MEFTASNGRIFSESLIQNIIIRISTRLKQDGGAFIIYWEKELLEWFLDKEIEVNPIELHKDITEDELKQLEQLIDYLEL